MTGLSALWLPILVSAVFVFIASSLIHMASPWHKSDYPKLANEQQVMDALRPLAIPPGDYFVPRPANREEMRSPAFAERVRQGPVVVFTVLPGELSMARNLAFKPRAFCSRAMSLPSMSDIAGSLSPLFDMFSTI